ncbi:hypothetical protein ACG74X_20765 [Marivita sp. S0852]
MYSSLQARAFDTLAQTPLGEAFLNVLRGDPSSSDSELIQYYDSDGQTKTEIAAARTELEKSISSGVVGMRIAVLLLAFILPLIIYERGFLLKASIAGLTDWRPLLITSFALPVLAVLICSLIFQKRRWHMVRNTGLGKFKGHTLKLSRLMFFAVAVTIISHELVVSGVAAKISQTAAVRSLQVELNYPAPCDEVSALGRIWCSLDTTKSILGFALSGPLPLKELIER